jgi:bifunctional DNA-binding transcriptional regulator/antitoxin component of YhaV-PrlF toxin-antitoxin module
MSEFTAKVRKAGQITIPVRVREIESIDEGCSVILVVKEVVVKEPKP